MDTLNSQNNNNSRLGLKRKDKSRDLNSKVTNTKITAFKASTEADKSYLFDPNISLLSRSSPNLSPRNQKPTEESDYYQSNKPQISLSLEDKVPKVPKEPFISVEPGSKSARTSRVQFKEGEKEKRRSGTPLPRRHFESPKSHLDVPVRNPVNRSLSSNKEKKGASCDKRSRKSRRYSVNIERKEIRPDKATQASPFSERLRGNELKQFLPKQFYKRDKIVATSAILQKNKTGAPYAVKIRYGENVGDVRVYYLISGNEFKKVCWYKKKDEKKELGKGQNGHVKEKGQAAIKRLAYGNDYLEYIDDFRKLSLQMMKCRFITPFLFFYSSKNPNIVKQYSTLHPQNERKKLSDFCINMENGSVIEICDCIQFMNDLSDAMKDDPGFKYVDLTANNAMVKINEIIDGANKETENTEGRIILIDTDENAKCYGKDGEIHGAPASIPGCDRSSVINGYETMEEDSCSAMKEVMFTWMLACKDSEDVQIARDRLHTFYAALLLVAQAAYCGQPSNLRYSESIEFEINRSKLLSIIKPNYRKSISAFVGELEVMILKPARYVSQHKLGRNDKLPEMDQKNIEKSLGKLTVKLNEFLEMGLGHLFDPDFVPLEIADLLKKQAE